MSQQIFVDASASTRMATAGSCKPLARPFCSTWRTFKLLNHGDLNEGTVVSVKAGSASRALRPQPSS